MSKIKIKYNVLWVSIILVFVLGIVGCGGNQTDTQTETQTETTVPEVEDPASFFDGKMMTMIVPYSAGGGFDTMARIAVKHMEKYIPGCTIIVKNAGGAGGLIGMNELYRAEPDGLTIGIVNGTGVTMLNLTTTEKIEFSLDEFSYLGRLVSEPKLVQGSALAEYKTMEDVFKSEQEVTVSTTGPGSGDHQSLAVLLNVFDAKYKFVTGYAGLTEAGLATVRNETNITQGSLATALAFIQTNDLIPLAVIATEVPEILADHKVPRITDLATNQEQEKATQYLTSLFGVERLIATSPDVPSERLEFLRDVLEKVSNDQEFISDATKANLGLDYASGEEVTMMLKQMGEDVDTIKPYLDTKL